MNKKEEWMKEEYQDMIEAIESRNGNGRIVRT